MIGAHLIEEQSLVVDVDDHDRAYALLERIADLNHSRWVPTIARVLDEFDRPGTVIRLGEIDLDLGDFAPGEVEQADERLADALRAALARAIEQANAPGEACAIPAAAALLESFDHYLLHGTWPYRAALEPGRAPAALLDALIADDPIALVALLRRRAGNEAVIRRLVRQMPEAILARLLDRIDPTSAAYVAAYFEQVRSVHAAEPVIDATAPELDAILWTIALRDALNRAGLRANRKAFVRSLIEGLALAGGRQVDDLYRQLARALDHAGAPRATPGSLLTILREIVAERPAVPPRAPFAEVADWIEGRRSELDAASFRQALRDHPAAIRLLLTRLAKQDASALWARTRRHVTLSELAGAMTDNPTAALPGPKLDDARAEEILSAFADEADANDIVAARKNGAERETALDALVRLIAHDPAHPAIANALARALADDPRATPMRLRDLARADAARLERAIDDVPEVLVPTPLAMLWRELIKMLAPTAGERAILLRAATTVPAATSPALFARATLAALARARGVTPVALLEQMIDRAGPVSPLRAVTPALVLAAARNAARREEALALAAILFAPRSPLPIELRAAALDRLMSALSGTPAETLRARLRDGALRRGETERLLAAAERGTLVRLALLLAPLARLDHNRLRGLIDAPHERRAALVAALIFEPGILSQSPPLELMPVRTSHRARASGPAGRAIAATFRARPLAAIDLVLAGAPDADERLTALLADPATPALLFAGFAPAERRAALALGRLLTGTAGRRAIDATRVAEALTATLAMRDWRGGAGFAAAWLAALLHRASLGEQAAIRRLVDRDWPAEDRAIPALLGLAADGEPEPDAPGSAGWARALLEANSNAARLRLRRALRDVHIRDRLASGILTEATLARLLVLAQPLAAADMLRIAGQVAAARAAAGRPIGRAAWWRLLLALAMQDRVDLGELVARMIHGGKDAPLPVPPHERTRVTSDLTRTAKRSGDAVLAMALEQGMPPHRASPAKPPEPVESTGDVLIHNAGLVLAGPFLPRFFALLDLTAPDEAGRPQWRSTDARDRAVHLTQMLVDGRSDAPEPTLALNRLLCGVPPDEPGLAAIDPTADEARICRSLLDGMIANWPQMATSSRDALQQTFLQREGRINDGEAGLAVDVARKTLDILLSSVGWSYSLIAHPWMPRPLSVRW